MAIFVWLLKWPVDIKKQYGVGAEINNFGVNTFEFNAGSASYYICDRCLSFSICKMGKDECRPPCVPVRIRGAGTNCLQHSSDHSKHGLMQPLSSYHIHH